MAKKKKLQQAQQQAPAPMTKRQLSRWQKQKRQERVALGFVIATIAVVIMILAFGLWREVLSRPGQVVARVSGTNVTLGQLADASKYRAITLDKNIQYTQAQISQIQATSADDPTASIYAQLYQQQLQQMQMDRLQLSNGQSVLQSLIDYELIKQRVTSLGGSVTTADIDAAIQKQFQPTAPAASEPISPTATLTETTGLTPTPSPTAIPADAWQTQYKAALTEYKITDADFRRFDMEPVVWREKLKAFMAPAVPTTTEKIKVRSIVLTDTVEADNVLALLKASPAPSFEDVAKERSTDTYTKDQGGDMGWVARGQNTTEFDDAAFALQPGQISGVISTTTGLYIIKVEDRNSQYPLTEDEISQNVSTALSDWLTEAEKSPDIVKYLDADKLSWLTKQIPVATSF